MVSCPASQKVGVRQKLKLHDKPCGVAEEARLGSKDLSNGFPETEPKLPAAALQQDHHKQRQEDARFLALAK